MVGVMAARARVAKVRVCRSDRVVGGGGSGSDGGDGGIDGGGAMSATDEAELLRL